MKSTKFALVAILAIANLSGCASAPPQAPQTVGAYCEGQARLVVNRMAVSSMNASPLAGNSDPQTVRDYVYKDCLEKAKAHAGAN
jgi:predicted component of type VI protein secretion system